MKTEEEIKEARIKALEKARAAKKEKAEKETPEKTEPKKTEVVVENINGVYIRTYTLKDHGEDFEAMARKFVNSPKNRVKKYKVV